MDAGVIGGLCGVATFIVVLIALLLVTRKDRSIKCKYDERQELVRGRGYKYAFFTMIICDAVFIVLNEDAGLERYITSSLEMFIAFCVGVAVYASYCIWHEGYFGLNSNPGRRLAVIILLGVMNIVLGIVAWRNGSCFEDGALTYQFSNAVVGILSLWVSVIVALKWMRDKKEDE